MLNPIKEFAVSLGIDHITCNKHTEIFQLRLYAEQPLHGIALKLKTGGEYSLNIITMKKKTTPKKLQLVKIKIANLSQPRPKGDVCLTSLEQTTCPNCHQQ
ncbi:hypothetical protein [Chitinophaga filiformis]|uniref:Uncharacterized protein n=1 Tax=Chitinophaga filiformis TaxID=104663 RepID=A0A1G7MD25_CHIFI|nr:hypothetical protein [Chitinophaga filiformis]SDF59728.1 hypothetical protein SAMN04488121_102380 [Chitinophaga filiformis]